MPYPGAQERHQLKRASNRAALVSAFGALVLFATLGASGFRLKSLSDEIAEKQTSLGSVTLKLQDATEELASAKTELQHRESLLENRQKALAVLEEEVRELENKKKDLIAKNEELSADRESLEYQWEVASADIQKQRILAHRYTADDAEAPLPFVIRPRASAKPLPGSETHYDFALWLEVPPQRRDEIRKVEYFFNHPTFVEKTRESTDRSDGFRVGYRGYGALDRVIITLHLTDGTKEKMAFNMYREVNREREAHQREIPVKGVTPAVRREGPDESEEPEEASAPAEPVPKYRGPR